MPPKVDIKLGTSLVQTYDGSPDSMLAFLDAVDLFADTVADEFATATPAEREAAQNNVYKFVKTRLTGKARQIIAGVENLAQLTTKIKEQCCSKINSDQIRAKLKALKQKGSINDLCEEVEKLTLQLATKYAEEKIPIDKANQMATKCGIETLINGTTSNDCKLVLKAGSFSAINDAIQKVQEIHSDNNDVIQKANVFYTKKITHEETTNKTEVISEEIEDITIANDIPNPTNKIGIIRNIEEIQTEVEGNSDIINKGEIGPSKDNQPQIMECFGQIVFKISQFPIISQSPIIQT